MKNRKQEKKLKTEPEEITRRRALAETAKEAFIEANRTYLPPTRVNPKGKKIGNV